MNSNTQMQVKDNSGLIYSWGNGNGKSGNFKLFYKQNEKCERQFGGSEVIQNHWTPAGS